MVDLVTAVAVVGTIATVLMVFAMLWFVFDAMGDDAHRPGSDDDLQQKQ